MSKEKGKKGTKKIKEKEQPNLYDGHGRLLGTQEDVCDCTNTECVGCFLQCSECFSRKCGGVCRVYRNFKYELKFLEEADTKKVNATEASDDPNATEASDEPTPIEASDEPTPIEASDEPTVIDEDSDDLTKTDKTSDKPIVKDKASGKPTVAKKSSDRSIAKKKVTSKPALTEKSN